MMDYIRDHPYWTVAASQLHFKAKKNVLIKDWRVGLVLRSLQFAIFLISINSLFINQQYLEDEIPISYLQMYSEDGKLTDTVTAESEAFVKDDSSDTLCNNVKNKEYDFVWSEGWTYNMTNCKVAHQAFVAKKGADMSSYFFTFMSQNTNTMRVAAPTRPMTSDQCLDHFRNNHFEGFKALLSMNTTERTIEAAERLSCTYEYGSLYTQELLRTPGENGVCACSISGSFIYVGVESMVLSMDHSVNAYGEHFQPHVLVRSANNPKKNKMVFQKSERVTLSVADILSAAEIDLDKPLNVEPNNQWLNNDASAKQALLGPVGVATNTYPYARITGVRMSVHLAYYNFHQVPGERPTTNPKHRFGKRSRDVVCVLTFRPFLMWQTMGNEVNNMRTVFNQDGSAKATYNEHNYLYGMLLQFETEGKMSKFSLVVLINTLSNSFVMLQSAEVFVAIIAGSCLGNKSKLYSELIDEKVSIIQLYSRFIMQIVAACSIFKAIDEDDSGQIDGTEFVTGIHAIFGDALSKSETETLVRMTVDNAGGQLSLAELLNRNLSDLDEQKKVPLDQITVNQTKFVKCFVGPPCNLDGCIALIRELQKKEQKQEARKESMKCMRRSTSMNTLKELREDSDEDDASKLNDMEEGAEFTKNPLDSKLDQSAAALDLDDQKLELSPKDMTPVNGTRPRGRKSVVVEHALSASNQKLAVELGHMRSDLNACDSEHEFMKGMLVKQQQTIDFLLSKVQDLESQWMEITETDNESSVTGLTRGYNSTFHPKPPPRAAQDSREANVNGVPYMSPANPDWNNNPTYGREDPSMVGEMENMSALASGFDAEEARLDEMDRIFEAINFARERLKALAKAKEDNDTDTGPASDDVIAMLRGDGPSSSSASLARPPMSDR